MQGLRQRAPRLPLGTGVQDRESLWMPGLFFLESREEHWFTFSFHLHKALHPEVVTSGKFGIYNKHNFPGFSVLAPPNEGLHEMLRTQCSISVNAASEVGLQDIVNILNLFIHMQSMVFVNGICALFLFFPAL